MPFTPPTHDPRDCTCGGATNPGLNGGVARTAIACRCCDGEAWEPAPGPYDPLGDLLRVQAEQAGRDAIRAMYPDCGGEVLSTYSRPRRHL